MLYNVYPKCIALGTKNEQRLLYQISRDNDGAASLQKSQNTSAVGDPESVTVRRLDDVLMNMDIDMVQGMKIDVEGAELDVLSGFSKYLERGILPKFIYSECIDENLQRFGNGKTDLLNNFLDYGYKIFTHYLGRWEPVKTNNKGEYVSSAHILAIL